MKRKFFVAISAVAFFAFSVGMAFAYFTYTQRTPLGQFQTGSTEIVITPGSVDTQDLLPGQTQMFSYSIENTGTVPVNVRSQLESFWSDPLLDTQMVQGVELTVNHGAGYQTVYSNPFVVNAEFYFSDSGDEDALWELAPGDTWDIQVTVQLSEDAGTEYMRASYTVEAIVGVRETGDQVPWPLFQ